MNDTMYISLYSMYLYVYVLSVCLSIFPPLSVRVRVMLCVYVWLDVMWSMCGDLICCGSFVRAVLERMPLGLSVCLSVLCACSVGVLIGAYERG